MRTRHPLGRRLQSAVVLTFFGKDHILFASDMPFDPEKGPGYIDRTLKAIDSLALSEEEKKAILFGNAERIFHV